MHYALHGGKHTRQCQGHTNIMIVAWTRVPEGLGDRANHPVVFKSDGGEGWHGTQLWWDSSS